MRIFASLVMAALIVVDSAASAQAAPEPGAARAVAEFVERFGNSGQFHGSALIVEEDVIVLNRNYAPRGRADPDHPDRQFRYYVASITKAVTAIAILRLAERGDLDLDAPIGVIFPGLRPEIGAAVTVRHLLTHSGGIVRDHTELLEAGESAVSTNIVTALNRSEPLFEPGTSVAYSNSGYRLLAVIVERVSGRPFAEFAASEIFAPSNMVSSSIGLGRTADGILLAGHHSPDLVTSVATDPDIDNPAVLVGAGGLYTSAADLARLVHALSRGELFSGEALETMLTPPSIGENNSDAMGWETVEIDGHRIHFASGASAGYVSMLFWDPANDIVVVLLSNDSSIGRVGGRTLGFGVMSLLAGGVAPPLPQAPLAAFLDHLQRDGPETAHAYAATLDTSDAPVANAAPIQAVGEPDGGAGETPLAWAPATADAGPEWLELDFDGPIATVEVRVHYAQIPGAITGIQWEGGLEQTLPPMELEQSDGQPVERYRLDGMRSVSRLRLMLDTRRVAGWPQIDAVALVDADGGVHWATAARASTSAFDASNVSMHDFPTPLVLEKWVRKLNENGHSHLAEQVRRANALIARE